MVHSMNEEEFMIENYNKENGLATPTFGICMETDDEK